VGYQIYKYHPGILSSLREKFFEEMRLGSLRGNIGNCEPLMRNSTHFYMDMRCVRVADFPDNSEQSPNGLYAEELCQISRYIGMGQRFKTMFLLVRSKKQVQEPFDATGGRSALAPL